MRALQSAVIVVAGIAAAVSSAVACSGPPAAGSQIDCGGEQRVVRDCNNEIEYQTLEAKGGVSILDVVELETEMEKKAIRDVSDAIQQFKMAQQEACKDYNSCILDEVDYRRRADETRAKMIIVPAVMEALAQAKTTKERLLLIDELYRGVVPEEDRHELTFTLGVVARLPDDLGGGDMVVRQAATVPSDARMHFTVEVSVPSFLYLFQISPSGEVTVLFPNPSISATNPLPAKVSSRIPQGGKSFRVNDEDIGTEKVFFVVSRESIGTMERAFEKVIAAQVTSIDEDPWLEAISLAEGGDGCARGLELVDDRTSVACERGLVLEDDPKAANADPSMVVRNGPADDKILRVLRFQHVSREDYLVRGR